MANNEKIYFKIPVKPKGNSHAFALMLLWFLSEGRRCSGSFQLSRAESWCWCCVLGCPGHRRLWKQRREGVFVFAEVSPGDSAKDSTRFFIKNLFCHQLVVYWVNLTVFGNIFGKIPATHKITVINFCNSCN